MLWSQRTWEELPADLGAVAGCALLPVGATEQHGPHMGCGTDAVLADRLCQAVGARTGVPMLPTLPYGCSLGHSQRWPGTLAVQPITLIELVKQIGDWAFHSGVRRLFIVNTHVTNAAPLRLRAQMLRGEHDDMMIALLNSGTLSPRIRAVHVMDGEDWHANEAETALMLGIAPEMVRPDLAAAADDPDRTDGLVFAHPVNRTSSNGVTGRPSRATAANGKLWFDWMVEDLTALVRRGMVEQPPSTTPISARPNERRSRKERRDTTRWKPSAEIKAPSADAARARRAVLHRRLCRHPRRAEGESRPLDHLPQMAAGSERYTGYALDGLGQAPNDDEIASLPDLDRVIQLPWEPKIAWMPADNIFKGKPYPLSTRVALKNVLAQAAELGLGFNLGIECEVYVLKQAPDGSLAVPNPDEQADEALLRPARLP